MLSGKKAKTFAVTALVLILALAVAGCGQDSAGGDNSQNAAADFPTKPVTIICPYSAGGGSDLVIRRLASIAEDHLGVPINIVNMPGGSGSVGYAELQKREADGYTLSTTTSTIVTHKLLGNLDVNHKDYDIVIGYHYEPAAIGVNTKLGIDTLEEFVEYSKENAGKVTMGTTAHGGIWNIASQAAQKAMGVEWNLVPAGGGAAQAVLQAAGGQINAVTASPLEIYNQQEAGKLKMLGVMADERLEAFPNVPTFKEQGYDVSVTTSRALIAPKGTPEERIQILYEAFKKAAESDEYKEYIVNSGGAYMAKDGAEMIEYYDREEKVFKDVLG